MTELPRVFWMAGWFKVVSAISTVLLCGVGMYVAVFEEWVLYRITGAALAVFGIGGFIDTLVSRIILDEDSIHIISIARRRSYARSEFESARVAGGQVLLKRREGGWLKLPSTGANALSVRNTIHAWIKKQKGQETNAS